jgi:hypothetical protein
MFAPRTPGRTRKLPATTVNLSTAFTNDFDDGDISVLLGESINYHLVAVALL